ncbi:putative ABC transporter [Ixodes scapularis]
MRQLSHLLHSEMISAVLSSPIAFFEATPRGRIANRFLVDLDLMDSRLYLSGKQFTQHTLFAISRLIIIGTQSPFVLAVGVASSVLLIFLVRLAVRASHPPKFREAVHTSRILSHVTETMDSLSSVRAYGVLDRFSYHFCRLVDANIRAYSAFCGLFRYVRLVTFLCGLVTMVCTMLFAVLPSPEDSQPDPSILGLTISAASLLLQTLSFLNLMMFFSLQAVVGFERCIEYTELPPEDPILVRGTLRQNLDPKSFHTDKEIWAALYQAHLGEVVSKDPKQLLLDTGHGGSSFSVGQRQLVCLARALLRKPRLLVLDEATSQMDGDTDRLIQATLRDAFAHCTQLTIAHRIHTILDYDKVLVMGDGRVLEFGPVQELLSSPSSDPILVRGTLRQNLDPKSFHTDKEIWAALYQAHLGEVVSKDPKQLLLDTGHGGSSFSVGQRQLVCLARALLRKPRLLVLDEATSQMDGDTDRLIQATLRDAFAHCTQLTIAHRIHTILDYDKVLVMGDGRVLEFGPVQELLSSPSSVFRQMTEETLSKTK